MILQSLLTGTSLVLVMAVSIVPACATPNPGNPVDRDVGRFHADDAAALFKDLQFGVGDPLPPLTAHDAEGQPFELAQLRGHYSVLVFGCLT